MTARKLDKDLVFFNPGMPGAIFTYKAGCSVDFNMLDGAVEHLESETENTVVFIEDRRAQPRAK